MVGSRTFCRATYSCSSRRRRLCHSRIQEARHVYACTCTSNLPHHIRHSPPLLDEKLSIFRDLELNLGVGGGRRQCSGIGTAIEETSRPAGDGTIQSSSKREMLGSDVLIMTSATLVQSQTVDDTCGSDTLVVTSRPNQQGKAGDACSRYGQSRHLDPHAEAEDIWRDAESSEEGQDAEQEDAQLREGEEERRTTRLQYGAPGGSDGLPRSLTGP